MTIDECFAIYKQIQDETNVIKKPPYAYLNYQLKDVKKRKLFQELIDANIDLKKFFLANNTLQKNFFIETYGQNKQKCMGLYRSWDEFLTKKRPDFFHRIIKEFKKGTKIDLNNRDAFLELIPITDYLFLSALYPKIQELLLSVDSDWVKFHIPVYEGSMHYIRRVVRGYLVLKEMKSFDKLREKVLSSLNK